MTGGESTLLAIFNRVVDSIFALDMVLQFWLGYFDKKTNALVFDHPRIVKRYLSTWFIFDFMSIFPFWLFQTGSQKASSLRMLKIARLVKLSKLTRLARMGDIFSIQSQFLLLMK